MLVGVKEDDRVPEQGEVRTERSTHFQAQLKTVVFLLDERRYGQAEGALAELAKGVRGRAEYEGRLPPLAARLESEEGHQTLQDD